MTGNSFAERGWDLGFGVWSFVGLSYNSTGCSTGGSTGKNAKSLDFTEVLTGSRLQQGTRGGWVQAGAKQSVLIGSHPRLRNSFSLSCELPFRMT